MRGSAGPLLRDRRSIAERCSVCCLTFPLPPPPLPPSSPPSSEAGSLAPNGRLRAALEPATGAATGAAAATSGGALDTLASDIGTFLAFLPFGASGCSADAEPPERARFAPAPAASVPAEAAGVLDPALVLAPSKSSSSESSMQTERFSSRSASFRGSPCTKTAAHRTLLG